VQPGYHGVAVEWLAFWHQGADVELVGNGSALELVPECLPDGFQKFNVLWFHPCCLLGRRYRDAPLPGIDCIALYLLFHADLAPATTTTKNSKMTVAATPRRKNPNGLIVISTIEIGAGDSRLKPGGECAFLLP